MVYDDPSRLEGSTVYCRLSGLTLMLKFKLLCQVVKIKYTKAA